MGCNCGATRWKHTAPDGRVVYYLSEAEAKAAAARKGGTYSKA